MTSLASIYGFTPDSLKGRFTDDELIKLSDDTNAGTRNDAVLLDVIERALRLFHHHARRFYEIPIVPMLEGLDEKLLDLVAAKAVEWRRHKWLTGENLLAARGEYWVRLVDRANIWLDGLDSDKRDTKISGAPEIAPASGGGSSGIWSSAGTVPKRSEWLDC